MFIKLASNIDLVIQKAGKGNTVVIVDKSVYVQKVEDLLSDTSKFIKVEFNPNHMCNKELRHFLDLELAVNNCLKNLFENNFLDENDYKFMKSVGSNPGVLYGLCKVHKGIQGQTPPFRQILSAIGTCTYKLAKFFVPILKEYTINDYTLKDSFSFAEEIGKQDASLFMTSFDVDALFTNIPLDETISLCLDKLYLRKRKVKGLLKRQCKELLTHATKTSCFIFNNTYYSQIDGVSMGSPLGPTLANVFMCHYETEWLNKCPKQFKPVFYKRYVDDIITLFTSQDQVKKFHKYLNSRHRNINFTVEEESNNQLSFLDVEVTRVDNEFVTSIHRKPTFSGVYTNFQSFIPLQYKHGLLFTLLFRAYTISSNYDRLHEEIKKLKTIWQKNDFPLFFIDKCIYQFLNKLFVKSNVIRTTSIKKEVQISLVYLGKASLEVKKRLRNIFRTCMPGVKLKVAFSSKTRLSNSFRFKDNIPNDIKSLILYNYTCGTCNCAYIGKTKRHFIVREYEHLGLSILTNKSYTYRESTATSVGKHIKVCHNNKSTEEFKIIGSAINNYELLIKESLLISKERPSLNVLKESFPLYLFDN